MLGAGGQTGGLNPLYQIGGPRSAQLALKLVFGSDVVALALKISSVAAARDVGYWHVTIRPAPHDARPKLFRWFCNTIPSAV